MRADALDLHFPDRTGGRKMNMYTEITMQRHERMNEIDRHSCTARFRKKSRTVKNSGTIRSEKERRSIPPLHCLGTLVENRGDGR